MEIEGWVMNLSSHKKGWVTKTLRIYWGDIYEFLEPNKGWVMYIL